MQARSNKQQSKVTQHTQGNMYMYIHTCISKDIHVHVHVYIHDVLYKCYCVKMLWLAVTLCTYSCFSCCGHVSCLFSFSFRASPIMTMISPCASISCRSCWISWRGGGGGGGGGGKRGIRRREEEMGGEGERHSMKACSM